MTAAKRGRPRRKPGEVFGHFEVVADTGRTTRGGEAVYAVRCRCGAETRVGSQQLRNARKGVTAGCTACRSAGQTKAGRNAAVAAMYAATRSGAAVALAFGLTHQRVSQIVRAARKAGGA